MEICGFLYFSVLIDDRKSKFRDLFLFMIFHECLILFLDSTTWFMQFKPQFTLLLKIVNCLFFVLGTEIITLFWNTQVEIMNLKSRAKKPLCVTIQILALIQIIAINILPLCVSILQIIFVRTWILPVLNLQSRLKKN